MERPTNPRFPHIAGIIVTVFIIGVAALLVNVAWKSNAEIRATPPTETPKAAGSDSPEGDPFLGCTNCHGDLDKVFKAGGLRASSTGTPSTSRRACRTVQCVTPRTRTRSTRSTSRR